MNATVAHVVSAVLLGFWTTFYAVQFLVWWLDNTSPPPRDCLTTWPLKDGRRVVHWVDDGVEHYAVGADDTWEAAHATGPPPLERGEPITDPSTVRYLWVQWDEDEEQKRVRKARRARRARRERRWAKQNKASLAQLEESQEVSQEEPRVVSAFWGDSSTP